MTRDDDQPNPDFTITAPYTVLTHPRTGQIIIQTGQVNLYLDDPHTLIEALTDSIGVVKSHNPPGYPLTPVPDGDPT